MADNSANRGRGKRQGNSGRGGRGGRGGFGSKDRKRKDVGRGEWSRNDVDKRQRNENEQAAKRKRVEDGDEDAAHPFSKEEIDGEARKPKRKVAVMIGYAGSGYKGMQINNLEKTIEGDIFKAFVAAGAISKANADDPKKSSLVRCARTDKGVHAAGNVISLKLIVEEEDIIQKINENLPAQIRIWGIERTNGSFSCYQTCDSRWYEYLIPTFAFIPPHPQSFLAKKLVESAEKEGVIEDYRSKQDDVDWFWKNAEEKYVRPVLNSLDPAIAAEVMKFIHSDEEESGPSKKSLKKERHAKEKATESEVADKEEIPAVEPPVSTKVEEPQDSGTNQPSLGSVSVDNGVEMDEQAEAGNSKSNLTPLEAAIKQVKAAYVAAKKAYRISSTRRDRVQEALNCYLGTCNFHNYTILKTFKDPSAKRVIRSFKVGPQPVIINDTEWLSLKVHGQSFMMHQIRKMIAMVAMVVRCGSPMSIIKESYGPANISIPKAPGLGLLLERPVFDSYNERAVKDFNRNKIDFDQYQKEMDEFKQREIYDRIFREEEKEHQFHAFFHHVDHYKADWFLWVTASGISAAAQSKAPARTDYASDEEEVDINGEEG